MLSRKSKANLQEFPDVSRRDTEDTVTSCPSYVTVDVPVAMSLESAVMFVIAWESIGV